MNDDNKTPLAYQFRERMRELVDAALEDGTVDEEYWDPDVLGFSVFGGDPLLQQNPSLVADIAGYQFGMSGVTNDELSPIIRGMESRKYNDEFNKD